ncbi:MAG: RluA family pseudouridine synthase [Bacteroidia bacterium]
MKHITFKDIILFEDDHIIVVNKPVGMASLDDKSILNLHALSKKYNENLQLCHRLDKMTSGVLLMAKTPEHYRHISIQFEKRLTHKYYWALVAGLHQFDGLVIDLPLLISTNNKVTVNKTEGKPSTTIITTEKHFKHYTLLKCEPVTGRMHQIRAHLATQKCPIVGDELYGGKNALLSEIKRHYKLGKFQEEEKPMNQGYMLHAHALEFTHPATEEKMRIEAPLSKNFEAVLKTLEKYDK